MLAVMRAWIAGANKIQLEELSKEIIKRQTVITNSRELALKELRSSKKLII